ncbi:rop guanine nucleotide exchange factor 14 [Iris pallida]|uniref:Rop guanine nucleotide exchange factor 14 n=1 Tax=Iris pallida TaxID=29817 RepID=A0AAX6GM95_IRIPA|nr:rop guanine nucleotide exchange factor 14 [Iris pallida]KAJ6829427.1 rop guanine nucleotide exchange factor 14 [Iris pallida]
MRDNGLEYQKIDMLVERAALHRLLKNKISNLPDLMLPRSNTTRNYIENEGAVNMGGMCSGRVCYIFWFYLYNY